MFKRPIVIVVGAGSGFEYNMPLGAKLAADIARDVHLRFEPYSSTPKSGDAELFNILFRKYHQDRSILNRYIESGRALSAAISSAVSIDDALYQLSENPEAVSLGKICIILSILKAEAHSTLAFSHRTGRVDESAGRDGWIEQIFSMAISGLRQSEIPHAFDNITFINFNYDRCIEHYLFWSLQRIGIDQLAAQSIVAKLNMIRPYGTIGPVLDQIPGHVPFGAGIADPFNLIDRIRTYTESDILHDSEHLQRILLKSHLRLFLGFGFHAQNLDLLQLKEPNDGSVIATAKNINGANRADLIRAMSHTMRINQTDVDFFDMTAPELLSKLRLKIMMRVGS